MKNRKGFTLIELLATLVILSIIMLVAVPSTVSILDKNRRETFISDAKRLVALAESEIRNNDNLDVDYNGVIVFTMSSIDDGSFESDPDGKEYDTAHSLVAVYKNGTAENYQFEYYVQLYGENRGISLTQSNSLTNQSIVSKGSLSEINDTFINNYFTSLSKTVSNINYFS